MKQRGNAGKGKRAGAWLLTLVMLASLVMVPAGKVEAAETSYNLSVKSGYSNSSVAIAVNPYPADADNPDYIGDVEFDIPSSAETKSLINSNQITAVEVDLTINDFTAGNTTPTAMLYLQSKDYAKWNATDGVELTKGGNITLTYNFSSMDWGSSTEMNKIALRFANCADGSTVSFTINSAKLIATGSSGGSGEGGTTGGVTSGDVTAAITKKSGNSDWAEYNYSVTNGTESAISGIKIKVPYSGTVNSLQSWNCNAVQSDGYIVISHTAVLQAGGSYTCDNDTKFGFAGGASLGTPIVEFVYGEEGGGTSSSELKYELTGTVKELAASDTPVGKHGKLKLATVSGYSAPVIVDESGNPYQLRGASTHGVQWFPEYINKAALQSLRDEWGVNMVRLACYVTQYNGYTTGGQAIMDQKIQEGVAAAKELGMYIIVDWHIHEENPHTTKSNAEEFFRKYATMYKDYDNVIFEICNEPTGVQWYTGSGDDLYSYCKDIVEIIRNCGSDALIVCGTNTWSQDVEDVAKKPLKDDGFENILYTFHFYSGSHYSDKMDKVKTATAAGTPIFVTEFGICDASGNGGFDTANADAWIKLCDDNNISYACWSLCNKNESASYLSTSCTKTDGGWVESDLATTGVWLVNTYRAHEDAENGTDTSKGDFSISVSPSTGQLEDVEEGYTDSGKLVITVRNTSEKTVEDLSAKMAIGTNFEITKDFTDTSLAAGESTTIEVALKSGKAAGNYADTVTIQSGTIKKTQNVKQTVSEATVVIPVEGVTLSEKNLLLTVGDTSTLTATITPANATNKKVSWSSDSEIVTVDTTGKITAVAPGSATITVTTDDGGATAACSVTVSKKVLTEVTFPSVSKSVEAGTLLKNVALSKSSDDYGTFAWKNSDTAVTGAMTGAEVVYTLKDTTNVEIDSKVTGVNAAKNTVTRTVTFDVTKKKPVITVPESITVDAGTELKDVPTAGCEAGSVEGTFTWKETNKILTCQDNETGFTLVFTPADTDSYASVEQQVILIVNKKVNTKVPAAPELSGKTTDSVTLAAYTGTETVEYGIKSGSGSYTWQTDNIFTGLSPFTTYTFAQRFAADDIYEAGNAGTSIDVTTYLEETDCYVVDLSKLSDKYVEAHNGTISYDSGTKTLSLLKAEAYTIKGTDESVTISCGLADTVILNNAALKRLEAAEDVTIELIGNNVIVEGITGTGKVTIQNGSETAAAGVLTVSGSDDAAIKADIVVLESGQITAAGSGTAAAVKGTEIQLLGGSLVANADDDVIPIQADRIVLDGCQVQSDAAKIYSTEPVDREGNIVTLRTVTYKDGDAVLGSPSVKQNAEVTLPNLAKKDGYKAEGWIEDGTEEVLAQGTKVTITEDIIYQAKYTKITGSLSVEVNETSEAPLTVGYASDEGVLVTITNNTNVTIDELDISLDSDEDFTVSPVSIKALAAGAEEELRVCLKKGKGVNLEGYTVNLSISCDELSDAVNKVITRKVQKAQAAKPDKAPSIKDRTDTSVTLASVTGAEYGKRNADGTFDWQTSSVFTGLEPYTTYIFAIRYKATENTEASEASDTAAVVTLMSEQARYEVDVTQLGDDQYADAHGGTISVEDNTLVLEKEAVYTITGTNENLTIHAEENVTIILKDAEVAAVTGDKNVIILLEGESKIISGKDNTSAVEAAGKVTISKNEDAQTGSVIIQGGNGAAGITAKEVEIQEGTVSITGGSDAAGIAAGKVTITGEAVSVTGQGDKPAVDAEIKDIASSVIINNGSNYKDPNETPVVKKVESITVNISAASIIEDMTAVATAEVLPADAADKSVTWSSSNSLVAAVSQEGLVTAVSEGTADIIATANDGSGISGKVTVTVVDNGQDDEDGEIRAAKMTLTADVKGAEDVPVKNTYKLAPGKKLELNVTFLPENAEEEELTFASSNKKIAKVDEDGEITAGKKAGKATITVTSANGLKKTFKIQVMKKPIKKVKLKASKKVVKVKKKLKLKVTLTPNKKQASDSVYWKSNNPKIAAVTQAGVVKGIKKGKVKITAVATDGSGKKAAITIQVK